MQTRSSDDGRLLELIAAGDHRAFREIYDRYYKRIYLYSYRLLGEGEGAKEVANEVMLEVWKGAKKFRGESKPSTWMFGIAVNKIRKEIKRRPPAHDDLDVLETREVGKQTRQDDMTYHAELQEQMRMAITKLSPEHREVLDLTYYQGLSIKEIAAIMNCPLNTVKTRMFYARKRLGGIL
ncbi:MAG TPA: sigma-70 family RNA polymerase sigma factor, partial [Thermodesulfobacteriota bacterium]